MATPARPGARISTSCATSWLWLRGTPPLRATGCFAATVAVRQVSDAARAGAGQLAATRISYSKREPAPASARSARTLTESGGPGAERGLGRSRGAADHVGALLGD